MTTTEHPAPVVAYLNRVAALFPLDEMRSTLEGLEDLRREIDVEIERLREAISSWGNGSPRSYPRKRDAVLALMREDGEREFALAEIREKLIRRGELPDTKKAAHALQMTVLALRDQGLIERVRQGVYVLARPEISEDRFAELAAYGGEARPIIIENGVLRTRDADQSDTSDLHRKEGEA